LQTNELTQNVEIFGLPLNVSTTAHAQGFIKFSQYLFCSTQPYRGLQHCVWGGHHHNTNVSCMSLLTWRKIINWKQNQMLEMTNFLIYTGLLVLLV
jgi:hypothetical protein